MDMDTVLLLIPVLLIVAVGIPFFTVVGTSWRHSRRLAQVTCPKTEEPGLIQLSACRAAFSSTINMPSFRVKDCSVWPVVGRRCGQKCVESVPRV